MEVAPLLNNKNYDPYCGNVSHDKDQLNKDNAMLRLALLFFIVMIIAAVFGFGGVASGAATLAQIFFVLFLVLFLASLVMGIAKGRNAAV